MKARVVHAITRLELGGAQQNTLYCVAHHDRSRFDVSLVAGTGGVLDDDARAIADARVLIVPWLRHPIHPFWDAVAVARLAAHFRRRRVHLVHTHSSKAGILGRLAARFAGVPALVHTVHGWSFNDAQRPGVRRLFTALERAVGSFTDRILVVAESDRRKGLARGIGREERYRLVRSGIDPTIYERPSSSRESTRAAMGFAPEHLVIGMIACLKPQKAPLDFVETAAAVHARHPAARFFIAGDGDLRAAVEARIRERGLDGIVRVLGWRRDVPALLHAMDLFLLTSRFEGLPRTVLQAMAAGVPVVATAVDGTPEVVRDGETGVLVPPGDPSAAAVRILALAADSVACAGLAARARDALSGSFDIRRMVEQLEEIYVETLASKPGWVRLVSDDV
ncbi:MAG: glycosyltransferase family 4 protein [Acidobacteriia bacterium]|nr:glycosyltransferase family 4 protein [Terriglobia bacterium]